MIADKMRNFFQDHVVIMINVFGTTCVVPRTMLEALSTFAWNVSVLVLRMRSGFFSAGSLKFGIPLA
jgi:hypothetical protein